MNAERDRIIQRITKNDREHDHWTAVLTTLQEQSQQHDTERQEQDTLVSTAHARAEEALAKAAAPLVQEATADGAALLAARDEALTAHRVRATAGRIRKRAAARAAKDADTRRAHMERAVRGRWNDVPASEANLPAWAEYVAQQAASTTPDVVAARDEAATARRAVNVMNQRHLDESTESACAKVSSAQLNTGRSPRG